MAVRAGHSIRLRGLIERLVGIINVYYIFNYGQIGNVASSSTHAMAATCNLPPAGCHTPYASRLTPDNETDDTWWQALKLPRNTF